jgi:hypothetical protein
MNITTIITLNAILDLAAVLSVFALVRFTHRLHHHEVAPETVHPSQPIPLRLALPTDEAEELAEAA